MHFSYTAYRGESRETARDAHSDHLVFPDPGCGVCQISPNGGLYRGWYSQAVQAGDRISQWSAEMRLCT